MRQSTYPERDYPFGQQIFGLRTECNLTQSRLAELLGISRQAVVGWETGTSYPSPQHLKHLIELCLQHGAFHRGQEVEEIRLLWQSAHQRVPLDEIWLAHLLEKPPEAPPIPTIPPRRDPHVDWGDAPEVSNFYGREPELAVLTEWLLARHCRVVSLLGMGGIGKTILAARLAHEVAPRFERAYWRSLRDAPLPGEWLAGAIGFLSDQQIVPPAAESERLTTLLELLRTRRCLLVLDNFDTLFEPGQAEAGYRAGLAGYSHLLRAIGESSHQSCLVVTSREAPAELTILGGEAVRIFPLGGLGVNEARLLLASKELVGTNEQWDELTGRFGGNGLALKLVGERIHELYGGGIRLYLEEAGAGSVFGGIRQLLAEQVERSSASEQQVLRVLAVAREPLRLADLLSILGERLGRGAVLDAVEALRRRSLVENAEAAAFTLQSVVLEYVTDRLVQEVTDEIERGQPALLVEQALIQAQARDYVRQSQERLIGVSIYERLKARHGEHGTEQQLLALLEGWRGRPVAEQGYGPGNVVNLLRLLRGDLKRLDLSRLALRQAYLAEVEAQDTSLAGVYLFETVLAEALAVPSSVVLSSDGTLLAAGTSTGEVRLWQVADRTPLWAEQGHSGAAWGLAQSANGQLIASGGADGTVRLWETSTGRPIATLQGHTGGVWGVALSSDGQLVASGGTDGTVRLWEANSTRLLATLQGHTGGVWGVALSSDGQLLASGGTDGTVRLWETGTGRPIATLQGHTAGVWRLAFSGDGHLLASGGTDGTVQLWETGTGRSVAALQSPTGIWGLALSADGHLLASGGADGTVRLWETGEGRPVATLQGHSGTVVDMTLSADGHLLASASFDGTVRLWETGTGRPVATLQGHVNAVWSLALPAEPQMLASGGTDGTVRLWETGTGRLLATVKGHSGTVSDLALSADGHLLASGGTDGIVQLWEVPFVRLDRSSNIADQTRDARGSPGAPPGQWRPQASLQGHAGAVWGVALSADGQLVASAGADGTVRLWETGTGRPVATLQGHTGGVYGVALFSNGRLLASGGTDGTVRLWETSTGRCVATLQGHTGGVWRVAPSADSQLIASGDTDGMVRLWEAGTGRPVATLQGPTGVWGLALSADGQLIATGGTDGTIQLWQHSTGRPVTTLQGHTSTVPGVALSADGQFLASASFDGTVRLWEVSSGDCLRVLQLERHYERLDITGLMGITDAQRQALLTLGAVEDETGTGRGQTAQL